MRIGSIIGLPDAYSQFARIKEGDSVGFTVDAGEVPKDAAIGDSFAYKVSIFGNDSGLAHSLSEDE